MLRKLLIKQYPKDWRDRYGDEMLAVLEDAPMTAFAVADTVRGAIDAHLYGLRSRAVVHRRRRPGPLLILVVALTLIAPPNATNGPNRPVGLLPGLTR